MNNSTVKIYGMRASALSEEIRYVGVTSQSLARRLSQHWHRARRGEKTHKGAWMRKVGTLGHAVEMVLLDEVDASEWQEAERRYISQFQNLTNSTAGGEGLIDPSPETRERMRRAQLGKKRSPEAVAKASVSMRGNKNSLGYKQTPEHIAKSLAGRIGKVGVYQRTPESIEKMRSKKIGRKASEETRRKMSDTHRQKARARMSATESM